jgi:hypothetical protein
MPRGTDPIVAPLCELFNAFGQVNFSGPNSSRSSSGFGRITGAGSGRTIRIAVKLLW